MSAPAVAVREKPILFSGEMVRAILEGRKTQTRRVILPQPIYYATVPEEILDETPARVGNPGWWWRTPRGGFHSQPDEAAMRKMWPRMLGYCPFGAAGDRLWVRETHLRMRTDVGLILADRSFYEVMYADHDDYDICYPTKRDKIKLGWRVVPGIHMRRRDSRLTLEVTDIRVERIRDTSVADALAEGRCLSTDPDEPEDFRNTWNRLNAKRGYGWDVNPWVWVVEFRRIDGGAA